MWAWSPVHTTVLAEKLNFATFGKVRTRVRDSAPSLDTSLITFNAITAPCTPGTTVEVQAGYPLTWDIPLVGGGTWTLQGRGVMRCGG